MILSRYLGADTIYIAIQYCDFIAIRYIKHIAHHMSAAEGQERAMRKQVFIRHGNKCWKQIGSLFKNMKFWCRYTQLTPKIYCSIVQTIRYSVKNNIPKCNCSDSPPSLPGIMIVFRRSWYVFKLVMSLVGFRFHYGTVETAIMFALVAPLLRHYQSCYR